MNGNRVPWKNGHSGRDVIDFRKLSHHLESEFSKNLSREQIAGKDLYRLARCCRSFNRVFHCKIDQLASHGTATVFGFDGHKEKTEDSINIRILTEKLKAKKKSK